jgi:hypothetical protein
MNKNLSIKTVPDIPCVAQIFRRGPIRSSFFTAFLFLPGTVECTSVFVRGSSRPVSFFGQSQPCLPAVAVMRWARNTGNARGLAVKGDGNSFTGTSRRKVVREVLFGNSYGAAGSISVSCGNHKVRKVKTFYAADFVCSIGGPAR